MADFVLSEFIEFSTNAEFVTWQNNNPDKPIRRVERLLNGHIWVFFGTAPGVEASLFITYICSPNWWDNLGFTNEELLNWQNDINNELGIVYDVFRLNNGRVAIAVKWGSRELFLNFNQWIETGKETGTFNISDFKTWSKELEIKPVLR